MLALALITGPCSAEPPAHLRTSMSRSSITRSLTRDPERSREKTRDPALADRASKVREAPLSRGGKAHSIRIIGGDWKRTPLPVLSLDGLRPTPDRVRETLFNWLGQSLDGRRCLDLFAGSGALGFEAASRGAVRVLMVERSGRAVAQLKANQTRLAAKNIEVMEADALRLAANLPPKSFDVVFLDPPFGDTAMLQRALELAVPLVSVNGVLYVESGEPVDPAQIPALTGWAITREGKAGAVRYHLLQRENEE
ncbi:putative methyltransferase [Caballeronia sordidicola]|uniref:Putative methyltransferase n=2 Tax=Caballeronia sordidicola TaxID=196367 RepID=A0A158F539_CABSO|nr:putative methyltransferase [Caballeronia sordidicola]